MDIIQCSVKRIRYLNEDNGYTIFVAETNDSKENFTVVGYFVSIRQEMELLLKGDWVNDSKYGWQFSVTEYEEVLPHTLLGIENYLGSGVVAGIGPVIAKRIVTMFGEDTIKILDEKPEMLNDVPGIGKKRVKQIISSWSELRAVRDIMIFLQSYGIGRATAFRIIDEFGTNCVEIIKNNPYKLTEIWGIGFKTADTIALNIGFEKNSAYRLSGGLTYTLFTAQDFGHCYSPKEELKQKASSMLEVSPNELDEVINTLIQTKQIIFEKEDKLYLPFLYHSEVGTAKRIQKILEKRHKRINADRLLEFVERNIQITYAEAQKIAIKTALTSKISIITGGPGTGKTTTVKGIIAAFNEARMTILLAAPTGRAAKRLSETTSMAAVTIHRLLEANPMSGFGRNEDNKIKGDILIIDESSMIDISLMYSLLKAVPDEMSIIFIGDIDQLPPVGPGNVLKDMIASEMIPVVRLSHVFRQAYGSRIVMNAHRINQGRMPNLKHEDKSDFFFIEEKDSSNLANTIVELCSSRLPAYFNVHPFSIQVLSPMRRGISGVKNLNHILQNELNPTPHKIVYGGTEFRLYDKVMQIRNNYDKEVFNGDIGQIVSIDEEKGELAVQFDMLIPVLYSRNEMDELVLAYATTVHKAQGSEYDIVVIPITEQHYVMLQRNLLYTGITRAKQAIILVGTTSAIAIAVRNDRVAKRYTGLKERLQNI